ncbi:MAG: NAD(P)H-binding protein [Micrococcales bacterium]|nr:NAD(P)H-binding protein [Micrococcales bacterium]
MKIAIIGGHGKIALLLAPLLAEAGHEVTSLIRNPDHAGDVEAAGATALVHDIEGSDVAAIASAISGHDAVIWSAGAGGGSPARTKAVDHEAAVRSMEAAAQAGARRYVMVSYLGSRPDHGVPQDNPFWHYAEAKAAADKALRATDLDWTILGPGTLTLEPPTGRIELSPSPTADNVPRADVAAVAAAVVDDPRSYRQTIPFNTGDTPIAEALATLA